MAILEGHPSDAVAYDVGHHRRHKPASRFLARLPGRLHLPLLLQSRSLLLGIETQCSWSWPLLSHSSSLSLCILATRLFVRFLRGRCFLNLLEEVKPVSGSVTAQGLLLVSQINQFGMFLCWGVPVLIFAQLTRQSLGHAAIVFIEVQVSQAIGAVKV